jgi:hypothetical protein
LFTAFTSRVLERALEAELTEHLLALLSSQYVTE